MSMTDTTADFLTRVRNAALARQEKVDVPHTKMANGLVEILKREGFVTNFRLIERKPRSVLRIYLKYNKQRKSFIRKIVRASKPGLRRYAGHDEIRPVLGGMGITIISTSKGLLTDNEARAQGIGGEVVCQVW